MSSNLPKIVCDASSIISLHKGNVLYILPFLFDVYIPEKVKNECSHKKYEKIDMSSFHCVQVKNVLNIGMQEGEREMVSLAKEENASFVLTDDDQAFNKALNMGIHPLRVKNILKFAKQKGYIKSVKQVLNLMIQKGEGVKYQEILKYVGEK